MLQLTVLRVIKKLYLYFYGFLEIYVYQLLVNIIVDKNIRS